MKRTALWILLALSLTAVLSLSGEALAQGRVPEYRVTITNLTRSQVFSPPVVVSHTRHLVLFEPGQPALSELAVVAEDGSPADLVALLAADPEVREVVAAPGPVPPGGSVSLVVQSGFPFDHISVVGMLVTTNDAFFGLSGAPLPFRRQPGIHYADAYDAGSEANNESCDFIPGPPCGSAGVRDTADAEGFIHIHPGIHGTADLDPATHDWRNPVARIVIQRPH